MDNNSYQIYTKLISQLEYNNIFTDNYQQVIIYATYDLIHRLAIILKNITHEYIKYASLLCCKFSTSGYNNPIYKMISDKNINLNIINKIILGTNGVIFQYHYYAYRINNFHSDIKILSSEKYLSASKKLVILINKYKK